VTTHAFKDSRPLRFSSDLYIVAIHYNSRHLGTPDAYWSIGDFNGDGWVDSADLGVLASHWQDGVSYATAAAMFGL
jgi:hypothetical protein